MLKIKEEYKNKSVSLPNSRTVLVISEIPENAYEYYNKNGLSHLFERTITLESIEFIEDIDGVDVVQHKEKSKKTKKVKFKATKKDINLEDESNRTGDE